MQRFPSRVLLPAVIASLVGCSPPPLRADELKVCADPNNLPFSNDKSEGFENALAELVASELGKSVGYTWWAQRRGFIRNTLKAGLCDVVMGVPTDYDPVETTAPYYRSAYVFVSRADRRLDISSLSDDRLDALKIGVHLVGDDGMNTPPAHALSARGLVSNIVGYTIYGDYAQASPALRLVEAVGNGDIDIAAVWGPFAGYVAKRAGTQLHIESIEGTRPFTPMPFSFDISMGVRKGDDALKRRLDDILSRRSADIRILLERFGVPFVRKERP